jgi:hypothetical protein
MGVSVAIFVIGVSDFGVFGCSVDSSSDVNELLRFCLRIAVNKFSAGSDKMGAVWKLSVLVSGVCSIGSSGFDAGSDRCSGSVSRAVLQTKEEVQSMLVNSVLWIVGSISTKLQESSSSSGSGVGVSIGV